MRLAAKIMGVVMAVIIALVTIDGYLSVDRETEVFYKDMQRDASLLGNVVRELVSDTWRTGGESRALELIERANNSVQQMRIRWVWLDASPGEAYRADSLHGELAPLIHGREVSFKEVGQDGTGRYYTYVPVPVGQGRHGALEISESLSEAALYTRESVVRSLVLAGLMAFAGGLVILVAADRVVRRPLDRMVNKAKRIGAGDLSGDLKVRGRDELSGLAVAMNSMCRELAEVWDANRAEAEARIAAVGQLRHAERLTTIGKLSSGVAHELGTPLNVVAGRAKFISSGELSREEMIDCAEIIQDQAERMTKIIRGLLDFARRRPAQKSPTNLRNTVDRVLAMLAPTAREHRVTLEVLEEGAVPQVAVDASQMQQVLTNLVVNGIQAMPGGGRLQVRLGLETARSPSAEGTPEQEYLVVRVRDEGVGISAEDKNHVFDPFFTTKDVGRGTGLGLSIAYGIVQDHGGWISVESTRGQGSCFTIYIPVDER